MAFTKCWLAYPEIRGCRCDAISLHTELTGETIDRAKAELAEGFKGLYGAALTEGDDITLALDTALDPEGYRLKAADGHCTIEGGSEVGVLYGVFALLRNLQTAGKAWAQFAADEEKAGVSENLHPLRRQAVSEHQLCRPDGAGRHGLR